MAQLPAGVTEESALELYENAPCGYFSCLPDGTFVRINATLLRWLGYETTELLQQRRFQDLLTTGGRVYYETHFGPLLQLQNSASEISFQLRRRDGSLLPVLVNAVQLLNEAGQPLLRRLTVFDATDRSRYEQELLLAKRKAEEATRHKARFASVLSHEIRTPLHAIHGLLDLLMEEQEPAKRLELKQMARTAADDLLDLINHVLDSSRLDAGLSTLQEAPVDLRALLQRILGPLQVRAAAKGLALTTHVDDEVPPLVLTDAVKLGQVLTNLVGNAIRFTNVGAVGVRLQALQRTASFVTLLVQVQDTGIGLEAEQIGRLFKDYQQADYNIQLKYGGTGLGLAISQQLVELLGSRIEVHSQPGEGTTFHFSLDLPIAALAEPAPAAAASGDLLPLPGVRVLLADDDPYNVFVLTQYLKRWQVTTDVATDGEQVLRLVQAHTYDLVLMDLQMPKLDGAEAVRLIRTMDPQLPVVVQSAQSLEELKKLVADSGFTDLLAKPFRPEQLHATISRLVTLQAPPPAPEATFSLQSLRDLTADNPPMYVQALQLVLQNLERFQAYCERVAPSLPAPGIAEEFGSHAHRLAMTLTHLQAAPLQDALAQLRSLLASDASTAEANAALNLVLQHVQHLIGELQIEQARAKTAF